MISGTTNRSDLLLLLDACEDYMLPRPTAEYIISEVKSVMSSWRRLAVQLGASKREIDFFSSKLDKTL
jgi:serine/threonine-protein kinase HipA